MRALLVCPGRGSYQKAHLGMLQDPHPVIEALDSFRSEMGRPTLTELDAAERFSASRHVAGENASLLTFGASARDMTPISMPAMTRRPWLRLLEELLNRLVRLVVLLHDLRHSHLEIFLVHVHPPLA